MRGFGLRLCTIISPRCRKRLKEQPSLSAGPSFIFPLIAFIKVFRTPPPLLHCPSVMHPHNPTTLPSHLCRRWSGLSEREHYISVKGHAFEIEAFATWRNKARVRHGACPWTSPHKRLNYEIPRRLRALFFSLVNVYGSSFNLRHEIIWFYFSSVIIYTHEIGDDRVKFISNMCRRIAFAAKLISRYWTIHLNPTSVFRVRLRKDWGTA